MTQLLPLTDVSTASPGPPPGLSPATGDAGGAAEPMRRLSVALVNMPWARVDTPSIQCGLLQSVVRRAGHDCAVQYLNLDLAARLGHRLYDGISEIGDERLHQLGEWLFSFAAFGVVHDEADYVAEHPEVLSVWADLRDLSSGDTAADDVATVTRDLVRFRREVLAGWVDRCARAVDWGAYDVVGFSSTFVQNTAALALGRRIKERFPGVVLVYGGANFDGEMGAEFARALDWLDVVVTGEGDLSFPALLDDLAAGRHTDIAGVIRRGRDDADVRESRRVQNLDDLPIPDYHDYFTALAGHGAAAVLGGTRVKLPVEFSRGCWWGQKHHCTFCGLNASGMAFRPKSGSRAVDELAALLSEYPAVHVEAVDNILDMSYLTSMGAELAHRRWDLSMFFEVKANLTREQLAVLRRAGIHRIQPGIESLSSHVLELMRKGSTMLINIRLLKWARYHGITPQWNVLHGFPGETDEDYAEQARLVPLLHHLQPPDGFGPLWLERFSPYYSDRSFPISDIRPRSSYRHIYPAELDHRKIAYFFDYEAAGTASAEAHRALGAEIGRWKEAWRADRVPSFVYQRLPGRLSLIDRRTAEPRRAVLTGWRADAYEACGDTARSARRVHEAVGDEGPGAPSLERVTAFLDQCCRSGVMVTEQGRYLALALPENPGW
jgi:ribosomal peptide maturation radical SAM protein 1